MIYWILVYKSTTDGDYWVSESAYLDVFRNLIIQPTGSEVLDGRENME